MRYGDIYLASIWYYCKNSPNADDRDQRLDMFARFVGLYPERLSYNIFETYVHLLRATGLAVHAFFACNMK